MEIKVISPTHGEHTILIDDEDWSWLKDYTFYVRRKGQIVYALVRKRKRLPEEVYHHAKELQRLIIKDIPCGMVVDHINRNGVDNRKENLRIATRYQNNCNKGLKPSNTSGYKGVYWNKDCRKWQAYLTDKGKTYYGGVYPDIIDAAKKYNELAIKYHGEFARLNEIPSEKIAV